MQDFLDALASSTRQKLLMAFQNGNPRTVGELVDYSGLGQSTVSSHLNLLHRGGLLYREKRGKEVYYSPDRRAIKAMVKRLSDYLDGCCVQK